MKILLCALTFCLASGAFAHDLQISENKKLMLNSAEWDKGSGSLYPGTKSVNVFSNIKSKSFQIFYEDSFIPKASAKDRLPKECLSLLKSKGDFCKTSDTAIAGASAVRLTSVFNLPQKNLLKVRSLYVTGNQKELDELLAKVSAK